jgi:hypothetical protein
MVQSHFTKALGVQEPETTPDRNSNLIPQTFESVEGSDGTVNKLGILRVNTIRRVLSGEEIVRFLPAVPGYATGRF